MLKKSLCVATMGLFFLAGTSWGEEDLGQQGTGQIVSKRLQKVEKKKEEPTLSAEHMELAQTFIQDPKTVAQVPEEVREYLRKNGYVCFDPLPNVLKMIQDEAMTFENQDGASQVLGLCNETDASEMRKEMKLTEKHLTLLRNFAEGKPLSAEQKDDLMFVRSAFNTILNEFIEKNFEAQKQYNELRSQSAYNDKMGYCGKSIAAALFRSQMRELGEFFQPANSAILFHQLTLNKMDAILATMQ